MGSMSKEKENVKGKRDKIDPPRCSADERTRQRKKTVAILIGKRFMCGPKRRINKNVPTTPDLL